jgi:hypothetical protein
MERLEEMIKHCEQSQEETPMQYHSLGKSYCVLALEYGYECKYKGIQASIYLTSFNTKLEVYECNKRLK